MEDNVRRLLQEISENLCEAIGESPGVGAKLAELQAAGYSLNLLLDCRKTDTQGDDDSSEPYLLSQGDAPDAEPVALLENEPVTFRINAKDLAFLRSVGIDPTRPGKSRKNRDDDAALGAASAPPAGKAARPSDGND